MKTLRTAGIMLAVAAAATALALLPSVEQSDEQQPGIVVGEQTGASDGGGDAPALPGDVPETATSTGGAVDLPQSGATEQPADAGADGLEYEPSKAPAPAPEPSSAARSGGSGSSEGSSSPGGSSAGGGSSSEQEPATPKRPATPSSHSQVLEGADGEWDCDDDDDSDDDSDEDSGDDDGEDG
ncbi:MAG: hypothetical protein L0G94_14440 [Brachybacterium sp.]|uniref:hypothetical protein n=1 Tax=Brachybacterium sp. TaxID=1891286 RepID=UPI0026491CCF|nr:hypothetical protein [Brachybacterium sp.]MDN5687852.1 hypothetical protein [Brachybacterium sp.]